MRGKISKVDTQHFLLNNNYGFIKIYIIILSSYAMKLIGGCQLKLKKYGTLTEQRNLYCN